MSSFLEVLGEKLAYKVEEINVILPEEVESLEIRPGEDLVSLVTCTPYGINTHRLVITGKRVVYEEKKEEEIKKETSVCQRNDLHNDSNSLFWYML